MLLLSLSLLGPSAFVDARESSNESMHAARANLPRLRRWQRALTISLSPLDACSPRLAKLTLNSGHVSTRRTRRLALFPPPPSTLDAKRPISRRDVDSGAARSLAAARRTPRRASAVCARLPGARVGAGRGAALLSSLPHLRESALQRADLAAGARRCAKCAAACGVKAVYRSRSSKVSLFLPQHGKSSS